uniref:Uncharacterized protein n=1 Tax=Oryza punctata TaxID=4537 RepID=A0A0E0K3E7_ORYPU
MSRARSKAKQQLPTILGLGPFDREKITYCWGMEKFLERRRRNERRRRCNERRRCDPDTTAMTRSLLWQLSPPVATFSPCHSRCRSSMKSCNGVESSSMNLLDLLPTITKPEVKGVLIHREEAAGSPDCREGQPPKPMGFTPGS